MTQSEKIVLKRITDLLEDTLGGLDPHSADEVVKTVCVILKSITGE